MTQGGLIIERGRTEAVESAILYETEWGMDVNIITSTYIPIFWMDEKMIERPTRQVSRSFPK